LAILVIAHCGYRDIADGRLELDERVGLVVWVRGTSFAASTEVGVVTDSALVAISFDIRLRTVALVAERSIAVDAMMTGLEGI